MSEYRVEHPAEFRKDATIAGLSMTQLFGAGAVVLTGLVGELVLILGGTAFWKIAVLFVAITVIALQITLDIYRRGTRWFYFLLRARTRPADASRPVTLDSEATVQDLVKVTACSGPFVQFQDGHVAMVLRVLPAPTECLSPEQADSLRLRFQNSLKRAAQAQVEATVYVDVEPDLQRPELERQQALAERWPVASGVRGLGLARNAHHERLAAVYGRRVVYHLRLLLNPADAPGVAESGDPTDAVLTYLRDVGLGIAEELGGEGLKVQPLSPESIRDLMARQLDPANWRLTEPPRGTDWTDAFAAEPSPIKEVEPDDEPELPTMAAVAVAIEDPGPAVPEPAPDVVEPLPQSPEPVIETNAVPALPRRQWSGLRLSSKGYPLGYIPGVQARRGTT